MHIIEDALAGFAENAHCVVEVDPDRRTAIARAIEMAGEGDTVVIAGKGHEDYQLVNGQILDFDDARVARELMIGEAVSEEVA